MSIIPLPAHRRTDLHREGRFRIVTACACGWHGEFRTPQAARDAYAEHAENARPPLPGSPYDEPEGGDAA